MKNLLPLNPPVPETYHLRTSPSIDHIETLVKKSLQWVKQQDTEFEFGPFTKGKELELTDYIRKEIWKKVETLGWNIVAEIEEALQEEQLKQFEREQYSENAEREEEAIRKSWEEWKS